MPFVQRRRERASRIAAAAVLLVTASWLGADDAAARGFGFGGFGFGGGQMRWHQNQGYAPKGGGPRIANPRGPTATNRRNVSSQHWRNPSANHGTQVATTHHYTPTATRHWRQASHHGNQVDNQQVATHPTSPTSYSVNKVVTATPSRVSQPLPRYTPSSTSSGGTKVVTQPPRQPSRPGSETTSNYPTQIVVVPPPRSVEPPRPVPTRPPVFQPPIYGAPPPTGGPVLASLPPTPPGGGNTPPPPQPPIGRNTPPAATPAPVVTAQTANNLFVPDEILVTFTGATAPDAIATFTRDQRLALLGRHRLPVINTELYQFRITDGRDVPTVLAALQGDGRLAATQPNYLYFLQEAAPAATDPAQYAAVKLHLTQAHDLATGTGVLVAVIDTAIDAGHAELNGSVVGQFDAVKTPMVPLAHGTAMAGAIVAHARLAGVAPGARILAVRAFDTTNAGAQATTARLLDSLQWTATSGARVVNMSFAGPPDPGLQAIIVALHQKGIVLIAAAGNEGPHAPPAYPGAYEGVIAVTATDIDDRVLNVANRGSYVAVAAPGVDVMAAAPNGGYSFSTGTSIACAHVSGLAALMIQRNPHLTPDAVAAGLMQTAKDLGPVGRDDEYGAGLVDAYGAVLSQAPAAVAQRSLQ